MNNPLIKKIKNEVERSDIIIAPIADNRKFEIISQFARAELTDLQCVYSLVAMNIGMQYVIRTDKAINNLSLIKSLYISQVEKDDYINKRLELNNVCLDKVEIAKIEYRRKGQYIDELLRCEN